MTAHVLAALVVIALGVGRAAAAPVMLAGGGTRRTDCMGALSAAGTAFPAGRPLAAARGVTCADGDECDQAPERGTCTVEVAVCLNAVDAALPRCLATEVRKVRLTQRGRRRTRVDLSALQAAVAALPLPAAGTVCTAPVAVSITLPGPDRKGVVRPREVRLEMQTRGRGGRRDRDRFRLVCAPGGESGGGGGDGTIVLARTPGAGLSATIVAAAVDAAGVPSVDFRLVDAFGVPVGPSTSATDNPDYARVRFTLARLESIDETREGFTTTFPRYRNYYTSRQTADGVSSDQPTFDTGGRLTMLDQAGGVFRYTFGTPLPAGWPAALTHTVGAQIERTYQGETLVANPIFDFVPAGGTPAVREGATTAACNACHGTLQAHGGGRRELRLCQLCHTDQAIDPNTGNTIDLAVMVHKIHRGKDLPSVRAAVGATYEIVGFQSSRHTYGKRVKFCKNGPTPLVACEDDGDCGTGGTCVESDGSTIKTEGVGFPQDLRNCNTCHASGATAAAHRERPSAAACTGCHDDVNPGETTTAAGPPGTNHGTAGAQPDAFCRLCHTPAGEEFDRSVAGAHTNPQRSTQLPGLVAEILDVTGPGGGTVTAGASIEIRFRLRTAAGTPITDPDTLRLGLALSGPTTDFGDSTAPVRTASSSAPALTNVTGPDGSGTFVWAVPASSSPPADAAGTWRVGLEVRRTTSVAGAPCATDDDCGGAAGSCRAGHCALDVTEAAQNPVFDFVIGGGAAAPRRTVVAGANCAQCHGTFSVDLDIHGGSRNNVEYCVVCHNANVSDFARRRHAVATGAVAATETIHLKPLLHRLHTGESLSQKPFIVYGFGSAPANNTPHDFGDVRYPRDRRDCAACHVADTQLVPLPSGVLPTRTSEVTGSGGSATETATGSQPPTAAACLSCHDDADAALHAEINTPMGGAESCAVCHGEGKLADVATVHRVP